MRRKFVFIGFMILMMSVLGGCKSASTANPADTSSSNPADQKSVKEPAQAAEQAAEEVRLPSGTVLSVILETGISTNKSSPGDPFKAALAEPVVIEGRTVLDKGTAIEGRVLDVREPGRVKGRAMLNLALISIDHNGKSVPIQTKTYVGIAHNTKKRDAKMIGAGAGIGTIIGAIAGGGKGAAAGALIGGGAGTGTVLVTKGDQLHYPPETRLRFTLASPAVL